jgi:SAM-dependent methyltransferase
VVVASQDSVRDRLRRTWSSGDFSKLAALNTPISDRLVEAAEVLPGERVLDVACGSGNTSLAAARRWADVTGIDLSPNLLEAARRRFEVEGFPARFLEGDAERLPFTGAAFDVVLSSFGAIFAPDQERTAAELMRVCRPGGRIGMVNWTPSSYGADLSALNARYVLPPPAPHSPLEWGTEARLRELFGPGVSGLRAPERHFVVWHPSVEHWVEHTSRYSPTAVTVLAALEPGERERYLGDLAELARRHNQATDGRLAFRFDYLEVVAFRAQESEPA